MLMDPVKISDNHSRPNIGKIAQRRIPEISQMFGKNILAKLGAVNLYKTSNN